MFRIRSVYAAYGAVRASIWETSGNAKYLSAKASPYARAVPGALNVTHLKPVSAASNAASPPPSE
jgi:hypothetical protein